MTLAIFECVSWLQGWFAHLCCLSGRAVCHAPNPTNTASFLSTTHACHTACGLTCPVNCSCNCAECWQFAAHLFYGMQEVNGGEPLSVLTDNVRTAIMKNITRRMTPQPLKIRADIDMTCFAYDGVLHIQVIHPVLVAWMDFIPAAILLAAQSTMLNARCIWQCEQCTLKLMFSAFHTVNVVHRCPVKRSNEHSLSALCMIESFGSLGYAGSNARVS